MCVELKIKIKSLAAEARIIRAEERKFLNTGRCIDSVLYPADKKGCYDTYEKLYHHRIGVVRREARATHLAYAFIRGKSNPEGAGAWKINSNTDWITRATIKQSVYRMIVTYHSEYRKHHYRFKNRNAPVPSSSVGIESRRKDEAELRSFYQIVDNWLSS